jgi:hypothetical protein
VLTAAACGPGETGSASPPPLGWSEVPDPPVEIGQGAASGASGSLAYFVGGTRYDPTGAILLRHAASYDFDAGTWAALPDLPQPSIENVLVAGEDAVTVLGISCQDPTPGDELPDCGDGAARKLVGFSLESGSDEWTTLALPELLHRAHTILGPVPLGHADGEAFFSVGDDGDYFAYDHATTTWRHVGEGQPEATGACVSGRRIASLTSVYRQENGTITDTRQRPPNVPAPAVTAPVAPNPDPVPEAYVAPTVQLTDTQTGAVTSTELALEAPFCFDIVCADGETIVVPTTDTTEIGRIDHATGEATIVELVEPLAGAPITSFWTGEELLLWYELRPIGTAYRPSTGSWRTFQSAAVVGIAAGSEGRALARDHRSGTFVVYQPSFDGAEVETPYPFPPPPIPNN